jgi:hypothetical protein
MIMDLKEDIMRKFYMYKSRFKITVQASMGAKTLSRMTISKRMLYDIMLNDMYDGVCRYAIMLSVGRHDIQHNDIQHNDTP